MPETIGLVAKCGGRIRVHGKYSHDYTSGDYLPCSHKERNENMADSEPINHKAIDA